MDVRLVVEKGSYRRHVFKLRGSEMIVGRKQGCGIRVPSALVSRQHCRLLAADGFLTLEDLDSINGTFLNGQQVTEKVSVRPGDRLKVGPVTFVVEYELTPAALDRLLAWETIKNGEVPVDEFELVEEEADAVPAVEAEPILELELDESAQEEPVLELTLDDEDDYALPVEAAPGKGKNEPEEEFETSPDMFPFDSDEPMDLPAADQLRDFLAQLEKPPDGERNNP